MVDDLLGEVIPGGWLRVDDPRRDMHTGALPVVPCERAAVLHGLVQRFQLIDELLGRYGIL
jgi:hypothetical protein